MLLNWVLRGITPRVPDSHELASRFRHQRLVTPDRLRRDMPSGGKAGDDSQSFASWHYFVKPVEG